MKFTSSVNMCMDFQIHAKSFDVEKINNILGIQPTSSSDERYNYKISKLEQMADPSERRSHWCCKTQYTKTDDINRQIREFLDRFADKAGELNAYLKTCDFPEVILYIITEPGVNEYYSLKISADNIKKLAEINCKLSFEF